jgi:hypothetical protein
VLHDTFYGKIFTKVNSCVEPCLVFISSFNFFHNTFDEHCFFFHFCVVNFYMSLAMPCYMMFWIGGQLVWLLSANQLCDSKTVNQLVWLRSDEFRHSAHVNEICPSISWCDRDLSVWGCLLCCYIMFGN